VSGVDSPSGIVVRMQVSASVGSRFDHEILSQEIMFLSYIDPNLSTDNGLG
jgi:hypothetical protein